MYIFEFIAPRHSFASQPCESWSRFEVAVEVNRGCIKQLGFAKVISKHFMTLTAGCLQYRCPAIVTESSHSSRPENRRREPTSLSMFDLFEDHLPIIYMSISMQECTLLSMLIVCYLVSFANYCSIGMTMR